MIKDVVLLMSSITNVAGLLFLRNRQRHVICSLFYYTVLCRGIIIILLQIKLCIHLSYLESMRYLKIYNKIFKNKFTIIICFDEMLPSHPPTPMCDAIDFNDTDK